MRNKNIIDYARIKQVIKNIKSQRPKTAQESHLAKTQKYQGNAYKKQGYVENWPVDIYPISQ
jgi:hypothetical protein